MRIEINKGKFMKRIVFYVIFLVVAVGVKAQKDTVIYFNENKIYLEDADGEFKIKVVNPQTDTAENLLFEGTYGESYSSESNFNFSFSKFMKRGDNEGCGNNQCHGGKNQFNSIYIPGSGPAFEFSTLSTRSLKKMGNVEDAVLTSAYGFNMRLLGTEYEFDKYDKISFHTGIGLKMNWYLSDNNTAFRTVDGITKQVAAPDGVHYSKSWLYVCHLTIPAVFRWSPLSSYYKTSVFSLSAGMELGFRVGSSSSITYRENGNRIKDKLEKGLNVNPVSLDLRLGTSIDDFEFYAKYGLVSLFKKDKGPDVIQAGWGVIFKF